MTLLLKDYGIKTTDGATFKIDFSIPDNCQYTDQLTSGIYILTVQLKPGFTTPSTVFTKCTINLSAIAGDIKVNFEQILDGKATTKPKITIENC